MGTWFEDTAERYGCKARKEPLGLFIAEGNGSDSMLLKWNGRITVYENNAQAYLAALALRDEMAGVG